MRGSCAKIYGFVRIRKKKTFSSKSTNYRSNQFPLEWEIPSFEQSLTWLNLSPIFPLGEIAKCRRVNGKTSEKNSPSEESEEDGDDGLEEPVKVEKDDDSHGGERKSDSYEDSKTGVDYGTSVLTLCLLSHLRMHYCYVIPVKYARFLYHTGVRCHSMYWYIVR